MSSSVIDEGCRVSGKATEYSTNWSWANFLKKGPHPQMRRNLLRNRAQTYLSKQHTLDRKETIRNEQSGEVKYLPTSGSWVRWVSSGGQSTCVTPTFLSIQLYNSEMTLKKWEKKKKKHSLETVERLTNSSSHDIERDQCFNIVQNVQLNHVSTKFIIIINTNNALLYSSLFPSLVCM